MGDFYEFFAGGGMARAGLGGVWRCVFSNDFSAKKSECYTKNWGGDVHINADVRSLKPKDLPGRANLVWASFPCQDLSLAGNGAGLEGHRSGVFWPFWDLLNDLSKDGRAPDMIMLENVCGALTSHDGQDFASICAAFVRSGYRFGALVVDAVAFLPQSRARLFILGVRSDIAPPKALVGEAASKLWHTNAVRNAQQSLDPKVRKSWIWWKLPAPPERTTTFAELIEDRPTSVKWHTVAETQKLLGMMSLINVKKVEDAKRAGRRMVGAIYKRTRPDDAGCKVQRAEVRFDDVAGCLRTPAGGSSRQVIMVVDGQSIRSRLISSRETARLMGLPDSYILPAKYNDAYHLTGDGVAVPVVAHLSKHLLEPLMRAFPAASGAILAGPSLRAPAIEKSKLLARSPKRPASVVGEKLSRQLSTFKY